MRILNLTQEELPELQGVEECSSYVKDQAQAELAKYDEALNSEILSKDPSLPAGTIRGSITTEAYLELTNNNRQDLIAALHAQKPVLVVLDKKYKDVAQAITDMQIGPEPGTNIPLLVPVEAKNKRWFYLGSDSEIPLEVAFSVDQNGNVADLANFVHTTPPPTYAQIVPEGA